ncbi:MAG: hypothetical protein ACD_78C00391G0001 [uncultured bacterium (gcode 4)]|uniref:AAA+ ATPase domain-containing protein n=1 Tax=uncultured bacterium (gcode 4) TaxID=1234023 RepID=K1XWZ1_9BACT|nr:MAG: hypothetical protein ACD_78C00391G0001 [uncultured bacterium (gcode 4)]
MWIERSITQQLIDHIVPGKVLVLYWPRQIGKTSLIKNILENNFKDEKILSVSWEDTNVAKAFSSQSIATLWNTIKWYSLIFIDEAQKIENIWLNLKLIVDHFPDIKIIATGSSSFHLRNAFWEPLVGRKFTYKLFPIAEMELREKYNIFELMWDLEERLIYGSYPEIFRGNMTNDEKKTYLRDIVENYLYKDLLELDELRHRKKIIDLLSLIAFQIWHEVSLSELGRSLELSAATVDKYLYYLEESFVIYRLRGLSRNLRKEITKTCRYYFYDNGVRNAIIQNFNAISIRDDIGMLWENFLVMERLKKQQYSGKMFSNNYFWRTHDQKEIDWVEDYDGKLHTYEFKYGTKIPKVPKSFIEAYPGSSFEVVNRENFLDFVL